MSKYVRPQWKRDAFNCPHCEAYAKQDWFDAAGGEKRKGSLHGFFNDLSVTVCYRCGEYAVWHNVKIIYPISSNAPLPSEDMPEDIKSDFGEARNIVNSSPRAACALLRLALQNLMPHLEEKGKNLNDDIGSLVKKGLPVKIQKALDSVRVVGNNAVHPGEIDLKDDMETAISLFGLLNMIVEVIITQPRKVEEIFNKLPEDAKEAIRKRNKTE